ncbi:MAG: peptide/nickel transport system permease protein, partial [Acetobacteraceae bacterium]|nr:peptide/nickel transport system permease protein [Acetobacteraceae bacterium]
MTRIISFLGQRLLFIVPQLFGILLVSFFLIKSIPGDPAVLMLGPMASTDAVVSLRTKLGLDHALPIQFW